MNMNIGKLRTSKRYRYNSILNVSKGRNRYIKRRSNNKTGVNHMNKAFGFGLAGSILGLIGSLVWLFLGSYIWGGFFMGWSGDYIITDGQLGGGFLVSLLQSLITAGGFVIALVISIRSRSGNSRKTGLWLLWLGIGTLVVNPSLFIPCILLIIASVFALNSKDKVIQH